ncbi:MAG: alpha-hydroxy acid oxidase [Candidatus Solibacter sp.]
MNRRRLLAGLGAAAASPLLAQEDPYRDHSRVPGIDELSKTLDFEEVFHTKAGREVYNYTAYGSEGEFTLHRNRQSFGWVELVPRGIADISSIDTATEVLGTKMAFPIMLSPTSGHAALDPDGEIATHKGATAAANTPYIVSGASSLPFAKIASAAEGPVWYQLYAVEALDDSRALVETAQTAGCKAIVMTVDQQSSYYERPLHDRNLSPSPRGRGRPAARPSNPYRISDRRLWYSWKFVEQIRPFIKVPFLAKGILTPEDAKLATEHGFDGVYVSNHGGRSLDYAPSTLEVLPEIVDAVGGRAPVLIDSGFRTGSDILKALALGAKAVCIGRAARWGLGSFGAPGVQRVLEILQNELVLAMAQTGRPSLKAIDRTLVKTHFR